MEIVGDGYFILVGFVAGNGGNSFGVGVKRVFTAEDAKGRIEKGNVIASAANSDTWQSDLQRKVDSPARPRGKISPRRHREHRGGFW